MKLPAFLRLLCLLALPTHLSGQISLTGNYTENFDTTPGPSGTTIPTGWALVGNNNPIAGLSTSDTIWAGTAGNGYNAALQTDITQPGDGVADRGLSVYSTGTGEARHITATFTNNTGGEIAALDINFNAVLYAARFDSTSANLRWDGLILQFDPGTGTFTTVSPAVSATFRNSQITFANGGGDPWTSGNGWATAPMITGSNKQAMGASLTGLAIAPNATFRFRWVSKDGSVAPAVPVDYTAAQQFNMNIGVDDISIIPTFTPPGAPPEAPSGLALNVINSSKIELIWTDNSLTESGFRIERSETGSEPWTVVATLASNTNTYLDTGLDQNTHYFYRVIAFNAGGDSAPSDSASDTTLADNPGAVRFVSDAVSVAENVPAGTVTLSVERFFDSDGAVSVDYETFPVTALAGVDFVAASGTLSWADGEEGVKAFTVTLINDSQQESDETFTVDLVDSTGGLTISSPDSATVTITNDDVAGAVKFSAASYTTIESAGTVAVTAQRTGGSAGAISIDYATSDASALAGVNYTAASGTLNWGDGDTADKTFIVSLIDNSIPETLKAFTVTLSNPGGGATLGTPVVVSVAIANDDAGFTVVDDFEGDTIGVTPAGWSKTNETAVSFTAVANPNGSGTVAGINRAASSGTSPHSVYLSLGGDVIADNTTGTVFFRYYVPADGATYNHQIGLADALPAGGNFNHFENQVSFIESNPVKLNVRNAGATTQVSTATRGAWYNVWIVSNNTADTYSVYRNTGTAAATPADVLATNFVFRNGLAPNALNRFALTLQGLPSAAAPNPTVGANIYFDDIYLDRFAANLANPLNVAPPLTAAEQWRQTYFGSPANSGDGADDNDFDKDGLVNLLERAFKTIPTDSSSSYLPTQSVVTDTGVNYLAITYRQLTGGTGTNGVDYTVDGMKYTVEHDADLIAPWSQGGITVVSVSAPVDDVETVTVRLNTPISGADKQFIRLAVEAVAP